MISGSGMFETKGKELFKCIKTYSSEPNEYGKDFIKGKTYTGEKEDNEYYYLDSTENGTCVLISNNELKEYFVKQ